MIGGGTFTSHNKIIPGVYQNLKTAPDTSVRIADVGTLAMTIPLPFGDREEFIEITGGEFLSGASLAKVGLDVNSDTSSARLMRMGLRGARRLLVHNGNTGGARATITYNGLTVTSPHFGIDGNDTIITVNAAGTSLFDVRTFFKGNQVHIQTVPNIQSLRNNAFAVFTGTGALTVSAGINLAGGADGTFNENTAYQRLFEMSQTERIDQIAILTDNQQIKSVTKETLQFLNEEEGRKLKATTLEYAADFERITSTTGQTFTMDGVDYNEFEVLALLAGMSAGCPLGEDLTGTTITGSSNLDPVYTRSEMEERLQEGLLCLGVNESTGEVMIIQDINTLRTFTQDRGEILRFNPIMRFADSWELSVRDIWVNRYMGRPNTDLQREAFRLDVVTLGRLYEQMGAIQGFRGAESVTVTAGTKKNEVVLIAEWLDTVVGMHFLYATTIIM